MYNSEMIKTMVQVEEMEGRLHSQKDFGRFCGIMEYWGKTCFRQCGVRFEGSLITRHGALIQKRLR